MRGLCNGDGGHVRASDRGDQLRQQSIPSLFDDQPDQHTLLRTQPAIGEGEGVRGAAGRVGSYPA